VVCGSFETVLWDDSWVGPPEDLRGRSFIMPLLYLWGFGPRQRESIVNGLVLERCQGAGEEYRRVGLFQIRRERGHPDLEVLYRGTARSFAIL
jgi:hypothetical protein